ncbi:hypothetical protein [Streptomyces sp. NPDC006997]|uniref:hypothetical protein n=1 Tax=Streptomyces sp. NPDC006997 TaxID=3155356 RepID=UPI0034038CF6
MGLLVSAAILWYVSGSVGAHPPTRSSVSHRHRPSGPRRGLFPAQGGPPALRRHHAETVRVDGDSYRTRRAATAGWAE